ncbi:MAG: hypothetical protein IIU80_07355 [Clostridia bacterium]|nr:hypothetical protein [Clostridia bacterium]
MKNLLKDNNIIYKLPLFSTLVAALICIPLRAYHYCKLINPTTGFFDSTDLSIAVLYAVLAVCIAVCVIFAYIKHKSIKPVAIDFSGKGSAIVSLIMAAGIATDAFSVLSDYLALFTTSNGGYISVAEYVSAQGGTIMLAQVASGILTAVYFAVSGLAAFNRTILPKLRLFTILPVIWCILRLLFRFRRTISFVNVSDLLLELFAIVFSMTFFLALAQVIAKVDASTVFWKLFAYGFPAVMLSLVCFVPRFILVITGNSEQLNPLYTANFCDLTFAIYAIHTCFTAIKAKAPQN